MAAFNIVRFKVKAGYDDQLIDVHRHAEADFPGMRRAALAKTGEDGAYCFIDERDGMNDIINARAEMAAILDRFRDILEDLGGELGVTDPVSGEVVVDIG